MKKREFCRYVSFYNSSWVYKTLKKAKRYGKVIVALTIDNQIKKYKGFIPELNFYKEKKFERIKML